MTFKKVLVANRGEIAIRVIRTCRDMGIQTVAVFSEADRDALHVQLADEALCVGPAQSDKSYLNIANIIAAAEVTGAEAIHPGYGFLAENAQFAEICKDCNVTFIGPEPHAIEMMGDKATARRTMKEAGVPVVEGSKDVLDSMVEAKKLANKVGYPVILKASAGGGGKGMRIVESPEDFEKTYGVAEMEARAAFGNGDLYLERYIKSARHIEVQILCDHHGNAFSLGERECSIQRRHQKLIEESPSPVLSAADRELIGRYAVDGAQAVGYRNAGTMEFIRDPKGHFTFMEMNTRLQVEHPVTEFVTGYDLVRQQLLIASGQKLELGSTHVAPRGHSIEFRINAEDPENDFSPSPGKITALGMPGGPWVRVDTMVEAGSEVLPYYDSMIAKVIVWGRDRSEALARARRALREFRVEGIKTTVDFHKMVLENPRFISGDYDTNFIRDEFE